MTRRRIAYVVVASLVTLVTLGACATGPKVAIPTLDIPSTITVTSPNFDDGSALPASDTCFGEGAFPPIRWANLPNRTASIAVIVYDRDAKGGPYVHRITTNLVPSAGLLPSAATPTNAVEYETSNGKPGWDPPCPPKGSGLHHYVFWVLALDRPTRVPTTVHTDNIVLNVTQAAFAQGTITATVDAGS